MSTSYVFPPPPPVSVPVRGRPDRFAVRRIYCVGRNYVDHAQEMGFTGREPPFFFLKPGDALVPVEEGDTGVIPYPSQTGDFHYEVELVVAIGKGGSDIDASVASAHVFGYAIGLDMTRRDLQMAMRKAGRPWCIGKAFDRSAPISPIVPAQEAAQIGDAAIRLQVNGCERQSSRTSKLIWNVGEILVHLSTAWELRPGDLIFTGTPQGVGAVVPGDHMISSIDGLGTLSVRVHGA